MEGQQGSPLLVGVPCCGGAAAGAHVLGLVVPVTGTFTSRLPKVTRVEVIDSTGRAYVEMEARTVILAQQDDGATLKVFLKNGPGDD
jgi:hypothetical protein